MVIVKNKPSFYFLDLGWESHYAVFLLPLLGHQALWGDGIRKKIRKIIGRSDLIMATPVEKQALNWHKAIWWVFTLKCDSTHYRLCLTEAAAAFQDAARRASAFFHSVKS